jgi:hypothetical protein
MQEEQRVKQKKNLERKRLMDQGDPLEGLITTLAKGYVDDADLSDKIAVLYTVGSLHLGQARKTPSFVLSSLRTQAWKPLVA